jgi:hypothetical protein
LFFVALVGFVIASIPFLFAPMSHLDSVVIGNHTYYLLEVRTLDEISFQIEQCDQIGFLCQVTSRSNDFSDSHSGQAHLEYDGMSESITVISPTKGVLYTESLP